ncbi:hypothetical protein JCM11251_003668 [Rhodosporidiobolus azoricus]
MVFNIAKCAVLAPVGLEGEVQDILLNGQVVPVASAYRYLGVDRSASSIDYKALLEQKVSALEGSFSALQAAGSLCLPTVCLAVLRTYCLFHLNYTEELSSPFLLSFFPLSLLHRPSPALNAFHSASAQ